jgi:alkylation response protein AidB-like acyl-CoA dehydrogenase
MIADLLTSPEEDEISASLRGLLAARCPSTRVLAMYDGDNSLARDLWPALGIDMGLAGLLVPEQHGGAGASARRTGRRSPTPDRRWLAHLRRGGAPRHLCHRLRPDGHA